MKISPPQLLNETGKRSNNEDSIFPQKGAATASQHFFLVCDGMGGHENGEVASSTVCESFNEKLKNVKPEEFNEKKFKNTLRFAYDELDKKDTGGARKMGTTLTFLYLNNKQAFMAHIGDSRIYHLRKNENGKVEIIYKSSDHSFVNELRKSGIITEEEAANHPKKNILTRVMQPHLDNPCEADIHITRDVQTSDYFFLCTDGVVESVNDEQLLGIIDRNDTVETMMQAINDLCQEHSRDNFSACLLPVIEGITSTEKENITILEEEEEINTPPATTAPPKEKVEDMALLKTATPKNAYSMPPPPVKKSKTGNILLILILLFAIVIVVYLFLKKEKEMEPVQTATQPATPAKPPKTVTPTPTNSEPEDIREEEFETFHPEESATNADQDTKNKQNQSNRLKENVDKIREKDHKEPDEEKTELTPSEPQANVESKE